MASTSVVRAAGQGEGNPLAGQLPGLIGAVPKRGQVEAKSLGHEWLMPLALAAVDRVMSRKEAAILCDLSESEFSKQITGADGKSLNLRKLGALGDRFVIAFSDEIRAHFKLDDPAQRIERAAELVTRGLAMLVAEVKR